MYPKEYILESLENDLDEFISKNKISSLLFEPWKKAVLSGTGTESLHGLNPYMVVIQSCRDSVRKLD